MKRLLALLSLLFPLAAHADWQDGGLDQTGNVSGNGDMISVGNTLIFNNGERGIVRSTDGGATWQDAEENATSGWISRFAASNGKIWAARSFGTGQGMLYVSTDDGLTWLPDTVGSQPHALGWGGYAVISDMYAWDGHLFIKWDAPDAYDIRLPNGTYTRPAFLKDHDPHSVASIGDTLFVISDKLHYTTDFGATWKTAASEGFRPGTMLQVDGERLYMMASEGFNQPNHFFYSDDRGESWQKIDVSSMTGRQGTLGMTNALAYFVKGPNMFLGTMALQYFGTRPNVFKSSDGGVTWQADTNGLGVPYYSSVVAFRYHSDGKIWVVPGLDNIYYQKLDDGAGSGGQTLAGSAKLVSPVTGSVLQDNTVKFVWSKINNSTGYQLQISLSATFATLVRNDSAITDTFKNVSGLQAGQTYYWRVRGLAPDRIKPKGGIVQKVSNWSTGFFTISSTRGGWQNMGQSGLTNFVIHNDAIYTVGDKGLRMSSDEGLSWVSLTDGGLDSLTVRALTSAENRLYVSAYHPGGLRSVLMYTTNDGATWVHDTAGLDGADYIESIKYWAGHVLVSRFSSVYVKAMNDPSWTRSDISGNRFAAFDYTLFTDYYFKTDDYGQTYQPYTGPKTGLDGQEGLYAYGGKLYAITQQDNVGDTLTLFVSTDRGTSWSEIPLGSFAAPNDGFGSQLYAPYFLVDGDRMWISVEYGSDLDVVYRSLDGGASWHIDTAGAWEKFKGTHFGRMIYHNGSVWALSGGPEMGPGTLYRQRIDAEVIVGLDQPELISPPNGTEVPSMNATLAWSAVAAATRYHVQVSTSADMSNPQIDLDNVPDLSYATSALSLNTRYYWRVRGVNDDQVGPWSNTWQFTLAINSVSREEDNTSIMIYPNPTIDQVTLRSDLAMRSIIVLDVTGKPITSAMLTGVQEYTLALGHLPPGIYSLLVETIQGEHFVKRLVVQ
jgi:photosystem II stability/assembly factor-like uncharacterized protein